MVAPETSPGFTSYSVDNDRIFRDALLRAKEQVGDLRIPLTLIAKDFYRSQKAIWQLSSAGKYPDLSTKPFFAWWEKGDKKRDYPGGYKEYKQVIAGFVYPILKRTGALERAASNPNDPGAINEIINKDTLVLGIRGSVVPYWVFHQSDEPRTKIPQRKFFFIGPEAPRFASSEQVGRVQRWLGIIDGYVAEKLRVLGETK